MVGSRRWISAVAAFLARELGREKALEIVRGMAAIPGANSSARSTLAYLILELEKEV